MSKSWCLILGVSSGLGKACALSLSKSGMNIIGVHLDSSERQEELDELRSNIEKNGSKAIFYNENAASESTRKSVVAEIKEHTSENSGINVLIHSLSFGSLLPFIADDPEQLTMDRQKMEMTLSVMAHSLVYWTQDLLREELFADDAKIFAMTSAGSTKVTKNYGAVSAAKCTLESHVRQLALELAPRGIAVNCIRAGVTITPSLLKIPEHEALVEHCQKTNPHRRLTEPEDIGEGIAVLAKLKTSWLTGNVIGLDGGEILTA